MYITATNKILETSTTPVSAPELLLPCAAAEPTSNYLMPQSNSSGPQTQLPCFVRTEASNLILNQFFKADVLHLTLPGEYGATNPFYSNFP